MQFKNLFFLISLIFFSTILFAQEKSVLFIGNSYTYSNEGVPTALKKIAESLGEEVNTEMIAPGGYRFSNHCTNQATLDLINSRNWDYVVLQEQSQYPSFPPDQVENEVYPYAASLCNTIRQNDICSQIIFFMTWGHKNGDASNCPYYEPLCTYEGMQWRLRQSYVEMAEDNQAWVSPVGMAFAQIRQSNPEIELYSSDNSHPSVYGTYLAACTFYSTIFHKSPVGASYISQGIEANEAQILQNTAWNIFVDSLSTWQVDTTKVKADFEHLIALDKQTVEAMFLNTSQNADSCFWEFGEGTELWQYENSMNNFVEHAYPDVGQYDVCLTAYKGNCEYDKICKTCYISYSSIIENNLTKINIYPNPSLDKIIFVENAENQVCSIFDLAGRKICQKEIKDKTLNLTDIANGMYLIEINSETFKIHLK